jgi:hypothetical protein
MPISYDLLETQVSRAQPHPRHAALLAVLRATPGLEEAKLTAARGGYSSSVPHDLVIDESGASLGTVRDWTKTQLAENGGNHRAVWDSHKGGELRLAEAELTRLYITASIGPKPQDFVQVVVWHEQYRIVRRLYSGDRWASPPRRAEDLEDSTARDGAAIEPPVPYGPPRYRLEALHEMPAVLADIVEIDEARKKRYEGMDLITKRDDGTETRRGYYDEFPELRTLPPPAARLFQDWAESSAGRSGAKFCDYWAIEVHDYQPAQGQRSVSIVPVWAHTKKIAPLKAARTATDYDIYGMTQRFDARIGHSMAWYYYMLHGNLVGDWCGKRVLQAAEDGRIVLPEHDYRVLKRWREHSYGF